MRKIVIEIEVDSFASLDALKGDLAQEISCCVNDFDTENMRLYEVNENPRVLKQSHQNFKVTYDIDYLLDNLSREAYLLESYRRWKRGLE